MNTYQDFRDKTKKFLSERGSKVLWDKLNNKELSMKDKLYYWNYLSPKIKAINKASLELNKIEK